MNGRSAIEKGLRKPKELDIAAVRLRAGASLTMTNLMRMITSDPKKAVGYFLIGIGVCLMAGGHSPALLDGTLHDVTVSVGATFIGTTIVLNGVVGILHRRVTAAGLRWLDLAWVSASSISLVLAAIQLFAGMPDKNVLDLETRAAKTRETLMPLSSRAFDDMCSDSRMHSEARCLSFSRLHKALHTGQRVDEDMVSKACPPAPIELGTSGSSAYDWTCIYSRGVVSDEKALLLLRAQEVDWRTATGTLIIALIFLAPLRLTKSMAETVWRLPAVPGTG